MRRTPIFAALLALALWATAIIACRAAFSPDGSRVLFPYLDQAGKQSAIGLHDLRSGKTEVLFATSYSGDKDGSLPAPQWTPDGKRAVITWLEKQGKDHLRVLVLPLASGTPSRHYVLPESKDAETVFFSPPPLVAGRYLLVGGTPLCRLDLETGGIQHQELGKEIALVAQEEAVYYQKEAEGEAKGREVGKLEHEGAWKELRLAPIVTLGAEAGELGQFLAVDREGTRFALAAEKDSQISLVIASARGPLKRIPLGRKSEAGIPGNLLWSPDGRKIFAAWAGASPEKKGQFGACEVPLDGGEVRRLPLFTAGIEEKDLERAIYFFQIALSPDGKTLAASSAVLPERVEPIDRALWLIDLESAERKVTRVALPSPPAAGSGQGK